MFEDSAILTQANFGLGMWNKGSGYFKGFNRTGSSYRFDSPYNPDEEAIWQLELIQKEQNK